MHQPCLQLGNFMDFGPKGNNTQKDMTLFLTGLEIELVKELVCLANVIK